MHLDADACYRAVQSRDPRFDGRFFTGVESTGIYCRPICPARTPRRENVRFFTCAAAAEAAGFRACMRCRPETAPGTPAWTGSSATVSRALRMISDGYLDSHGVDGLADALGVGARHLRRLFDEHVGASPTSVALTRRVHFARKLIDETALPVTEIAFSSGFSSLRRFNDAFRATFKAAPSAVRRSGGDTRAASGLRLRLPFRAPLDWTSLLGFLRSRAAHGVEVVGESYRRSVLVSGAAGEIEVAPGGEEHLLLTVSPSLSRHLSRVVERVRRLFDLAADPHEIASHLGRDEWLRPMVEKNPGLRVPGAWDGFEVAVRAVVGQQVSVAAATTIMSRIVERFGEPYRGEGDDGGVVRPTRMFPTPERLMRARVDVVGLPGARANALRDLSAAVHRGEVDFARPVPLDETVERLVRIDGIGPWTAHYIAMRACGDPDAFPPGDVVLCRAAERAGVRGERALAERAAAWRPWRAYAALYLWSSNLQRKDVRR